jgi:hypothetical protein
VEGITLRPNGGLRPRLGTGSVPRRQNNRRTKTSTCPNYLSLARGLSEFSTYTQRAAAGIAVVSLLPQAFGGPVNPFGDLATGAGEATAGVLEVSALVAGGISGGIRAYHGNWVPLATTGMGYSLGKATQMKGSMPTIGGTLGDELGDAANPSPCE